MQRQNIYCRTNFICCVHLGALIPALKAVTDVHVLAWLQARKFIQQPTGKGILAALAAGARHESEALHRMVALASLEPDEYHQLRSFLLQVRLFSKAGLLPDLLARRGFICTFCRAVQITTQLPLQIGLLCFGMIPCMHAGASTRVNIPCRHALEWPPPRHWQSKAGHVCMPSSSLHCCGHAGALVPGSGHTQQQAEAHPAVNAHLRGGAASVGGLQWGATFSGPVGSAPAGPHRNAP